MPNTFGQTGKTAIVLAMLICSTFAIISLTSPTTAQGQAEIQNSNNAIISYPFLTRTGDEAIALIDTENKTMCIYKYESGNSGSYQLKLVAARSYRYDSLLKDYNTAEPRPEEVKKLLFNDSRKD
ncbi:MAG: hypothetical protein JEZ07_00700 [Phycisphaerae bacterium]|nr:hypothetical protein [Phycisphaerae bacterium]